MAGLKVSTSGLTEKQAVFVQIYLTTGDVAASALSAGYEHGESGYATLRSSAVQAAIRDHLQRKIKIEGARVGVDQIINLARTANSEAVRLNASVWLVEAAGYGAKDQTDDDKPIAEMSAAELAAFGDQIEKRIAAGDRPLIKETSPETGRIPPLGPDDVQLEQGHSDQ